LFNIFVGFLWLYSSLPTPNLIPADLGGFFTPSQSSKLSLFGLYVICVFEPSFFIVFYCLCFFVFQERFRHISNTEVYLPYNASIVLVAYHCISVFCPISNYVFLVFFATLVGFHYLPSGIHKLKNHWDKLNFLPNIAAGANLQNGWGLLMGSRCFSALCLSSKIIQPIVITLQCMAFLSIFDSSFSVFIFGFLTLMHFFVFFATGIFFWKWILVIIPLIISLAVNSPTSLSTIGDGDFFFVFLCSLLASYLLGGVPTLSWADSPISQKITVSLKNADLHYEVNPYDLAPLDMNLSQGRIGTCYPADRYDFSGCFGAVNLSSENFSFILDLNKLSSDKSLTKDKVVELLGQYHYMDRIKNNTPFNYNSFVYNLINRLKSQSLSSTKNYFPNYHIWNLIKKDDPKVLKKILKGSFSIRLERSVYFFKRANRQYIKIHTSSKDIQVNEGMV